MYGSDKQIPFECISLSCGLKVFKIQTPQEVIMSVGLLARGNRVWLTRE